MPSGAGPGGTLDRSFGAGRDRYAYFDDSNQLQATAPMATKAATVARMPAYASQDAGLVRSNYRGGRLCCSDYLNQLNFYDARSTRHSMS